MTICVVVADASRARLFKAEKRNGPIEELRDFAHPASRLREGELVSDGEGKLNGPGGNPAMADEPSHKQDEAKHFASELCAELERAISAGECTRLYWIAPPKFLGMLREEASAALRDKLSGEIDKDLVRHSVEDIRAHLPEHL